MFSFPNFTFVDHARNSHRLVSWMVSREILEVLEKLNIGRFAGCQNMILGIKLLFIRIN
jgi:hypothetical protein